MSGARTILVVGTSEVRRASHVALLAQAGYWLVDLATSDAALAHVAAEAPPLVIIDSDLTDLSGLELCNRIKERSPETFILLISSAFAEESAAAESAEDPEAVVTEVESWVDAYLVDPIDPRELLAMVRSLLRLQKVEAELRDSEERLLLAQESAGLAILDWVIATNTFVHSDNLIELFDLPPLPPGEALVPTQLIDRIHPEDIAGLIKEFSTGSQLARNFETEFRIVRGDGAIRWIASRGRFFSGASGNPERMLSLSYDITERRMHERSNAELASIVASTIDAIVSVDLDGVATSWNAGAERLFGIPAADIVGRPFRTAFPEITSAEDDNYRKLLSDGAPHEFDIRQKLPSGATVDLWVTSAPMRQAGGNAIGSCFILRDVTPHKQREDHVRFLMRELTHRSKNLLAVIQAMARQSMTAGITQDEFLRRFTDRLAALAGSHDLLSSVDWKGASLMELIRSQLNHYEELFGTRIILEGDDLLLRPEAAQNIGIALHELSTNAAKYGALSNETGRVTIAWSFLQGLPRKLGLSWRETGGPPVTVPSRRGFGSVVMDRIAGRALGGRSGLTFEPDGVVWTMEVPAATALMA